MKVFILICLLIIILLCSCLNKKNIIEGFDDIEGCMESTAINYNSSATIDDGTCEYNTIEDEYDVSVNSTMHRVIIINNTNVDIHITKLHINVYCNINNVTAVESVNESLIDSNNIEINTDTSMIEITDMDYILGPLEEIHILNLSIDNNTIDCNLGIHIDTEFTSVLDSIDTGYSTKITELVNNYLNDNVDSDYSDDDIKKGINNYIKIKLNEFIENNYSYLDNINLLLNDDDTENEDLYYNYIIILLNALPEIDEIMSYSLISVNIIEYCLT